jgi:hypothetical protein
LRWVREIPRRQVWPRRRQAWDQALAGARAGALAGARAGALAGVEVEQAWSQRLRSRTPQTKQESLLLSQFGRPYEELA